MTIWLGIVYAYKGLLMVSENILESVNTMAICSRRHRRLNVALFPFTWFYISYCHEDAVWCLLWYQYAVPYVNLTGSALLKLLLLFIYFLLTSNSVWTAYIQTVDNVNLRFKWTFAHLKLLRFFFRNLKSSFIIKQTNWLGFDTFTGDDRIWAKLLCPINLGEEYRSGAPGSKIPPVG